MTTPTLPRRLHHHAFVVADQERTRHFYEDLLGFPLIATWCEVDGAEGDDGIEYCHTFFGLADGSALAFFQFADPEVQAQMALPAPLSPFFHVALAVDADGQAAAGARLEAAGVTPLVIDHGYCRSLYVGDPDGLLVELTVDHPDVEQINATRRSAAHDDLARWLAGDRRPNNTWRMPAAR